MVEEDVAFADDLVSITGSIKELQEKADIISGWCLLTGIKIAVKKLRTFGIQWGVKKNETNELFLTEGPGNRTRVEVKSDGIMTHLGIVWNMDTHNIKQWNDIKHMNVEATVVASTPKELYDRILDVEPYTGCGFLTPVPRNEIKHGDGSGVFRFSDLEAVKRMPAWNLNDLANSKVLAA